MRKISLSFLAVCSDFNNLIGCTSQKLPNNIPKKVNEKWFSNVLSHFREFAWKFLKMYPCFFGDIKFFLLYLVYRTHTFRTILNLLKIYNKMHAKFFFCWPNTFSNSYTVKAEKQNFSLHILVITFCEQFFCVLFNGFGNSIIFSIFYIYLLSKVFKRTNFNIMP